MGLQQDMKQQAISLYQDLYFYIFLDITKKGFLQNIIQRD